MSTVLIAFMFASFRSKENGLKEGVIDLAVDVCQQVIVVYLCLFVIPFLILIPLNTQSRLLTT